jgi:hypothetical protein
MTRVLSWRWQYTLHQGRNWAKIETCEKDAVCLKVFDKHVWCLTSLKSVRRVWRYQSGNQNPYIEEEQTTQWPKEKGQKDKQRSTKHTYKTKDRVTRTPLKTGSEFRCSERVSSSCSTSDTGHVNLVANPIILQGFLFALLCYYWNFIVFLDFWCCKIVCLNIKFICIGLKTDQKFSASVIFLQGKSCPWSYGSWIYNYLCNRCLITTDVVSSNLDQGKVYNIMW